MVRVFEEVDRIKTAVAAARSESRINIKDIFRKKLEVAEKLSGVVDDAVQKYEQDTLMPVIEKLWQILA